MNTIIKKTLACSLITLSVAPLARAQDEAVHEVGLTANSFGLGIFYGYQINPQWTVRTQISGIELDDYDSDVAGIDYEGDSDSGAMSIGLDWRPFSNGWASGVYFTGGLMSAEDDFKGDYKAKLGEQINVGGADIAGNSIDGLNVDIDYDRKVSPYLGLGWRSKVSGEAGLAFTAEVGFVNLDDPNVRLIADDPDGVLSQANIDAERDEILDDLDGNSGYASFGMSYRF